MVSTLCVQKLERRKENAKTFRSVKQARHYIFIAASLTVWTTLLSIDRYCVRKG